MFINLKQRQIGAVLEMDDVQGQSRSVCWVFTLSAILSLSILFIYGCAEDSTRRSSMEPVNNSVQSDSTAQDQANEALGKRDEIRDLADPFTEEEFPAARDLALIIPMDYAQIRAMEQFPPEWLGQVDTALLASDVDDSIFDENFLAEPRA